MPMHVYENWNKRPSDQEEQIEPYRKYYFICEGANTETFYFKRLIDIRKDLDIHPLIDIRLLEKTEQDRNLSYPKRLAEFAEQQKLIRFLSAVNSLFEIFPPCVIQSYMPHIDQTPSGVCETETVRQQRH